MEQHRHGRWALASLTALSLLAPAGRASADDGTGERIDWCGDHRLELGGQAMTTQSAWHARTFTHAKITLIAHHGCSNRATDQERDAVLAAHDDLARWSGLPATELHAYLEALVEPDPDPLERACRKLAPGDQASRGLAKLLGCKGAGRMVLEDDATSALASAGVAYQCLDGDHGSPDIDETTLAGYALCGVFARRIDKAAIDRELASLDVSPAARAKVHIGLRQIAAVVTAFDTYLAARTARDGDLGALFYAIPEKAFADAQRLGAAHATDLAAVRAFESQVARSRQPHVAGCYADLRGRLAAHLKQARATTLDKARAEMRRPVTSQIARALASCASLEGRPAMAIALDAALDGVPDLRGPRSMVYAAVHDAIARGGGRIVSVEALEQAQVPSPRSPVDRDEAGLDEPITARIKKVAKRSDGLRLEFHPVFTKETESYACRTTHRVDRIDEYGRVIYHERCKQRRVTRRTQQPPVTVAADDGAALASGRHVSIYCDGQGSCVPFAVWKDQKKKALAGFLTGAL
jgi:hypothetical protein